MTAFLALATAVGVQISGAVRDELDAAVIRLANSGQRALLHGSLVEFERRAQGAAYFTDIVRADWRWGTASAQQRLQHRVRVVAAATEDHGELAAIHPFAENFATELARRRPEVRALPDHLDASPLRPHQPDTRSH